MSGTYYSQPSASVVMNGTSSDPFDIWNAPFTSLICYRKTWQVPSDRTNLYRAFTHPLLTTNYLFRQTTFWSIFNTPIPPLPSLFFLYFSNLGLSATLNSISPKQKPLSCLYQLLWCPYSALISLFNGRLGAFLTWWLQSLPICLIYIPWTMFLSSHVLGLGFLGGSSSPCFGRINTLKMDTLPKLLYLLQTMQTIPILVPKSFISLRSFLSSKEEQVYRVMNSTIKLPSRHAFWSGSCAHSQKASIMVEQDLEHRPPLWGYNSDLHCLTPSSPLKLAALRLWYTRGGYARFYLQTPSPLTPLFDNPAFPQGMGVPTVVHYCVLHCRGWLSLFNLNREPRLPLRDYRTGSLHSICPPL